MNREGLYLTEEKNMKNKKAAAVIAAVAAAVGRNAPTRSWRSLPSVSGC